MARSNGHAPAIPSSSSSIVPDRPTPNHQSQQQQKHFVKNGGPAASQQQHLANVIAQRGQQQQHQPAIQKPPPLKPKPAVNPYRGKTYRNKYVDHVQLKVRPRGPMLRTLYPYEAQDTDELSFAKDQMIELVKKDESGWWTGRMAGKSGLLPANYVEEVVPS
jgi:hypothetical protein